MYLATCSCMLHSAEMSASVLLVGTQPCDVFVVPFEMLSNFSNESVAWAGRSIEYCLLCAVHVPGQQVQTVQHALCMWALECVQGQQVAKQEAKQAEQPKSQEDPVTIYHRYAAQPDA